MKTSALASLLCAFAVLPFASSLNAADAYSTTFATPPYTLGTTVIGTDGWVLPSAGSSSASTLATVIAAPWDSNARVLSLAGSATNNRLKNSSFTAFTTGEVEANASLAFDATTSHSGRYTQVAFQDLTSTSSPLTFGLNYTSTGGLYYQARGDVEVVILAKSDVKLNALYVFSLDIDLDASTFDILVTGIKADDSPFTYSQSGITWTGSKSFSTLFLNNTSAYTSYVDAISIHPVPEPSSVALLAIGAVLVGVSQARKQRK